MILFIDTEWADVLASELVSLALVGDCGRYEFYAERDPLPDKPTDFVRSLCIRYSSAALKLCLMINSPQPYTSSSQMYWT